ncbi:hypothetical protein ASPZODRAFT_88998 [Penicilliopsis zonata CBS 506.65]|uniref:Uncharacterized protein n=1 Tax=Penicilliopsis zonata CBS 506.65 TaxID=1073090 RepID=A0A1L9SR78_9EURO|nr:hypothetical protein ASPZODRAFT_88998 [Penicilliopsis zonata CBS 506.65]OJJ49658.1 hypothetical protein ASPZODRAFT_88998 [Penicilliopsis zonata CBS 506.65]
MAPGISDVPVSNDISQSQAPTKQPPPLIHHSLVTAEYDALKFHAAASLQLLPLLSPDQRKAITTLSDHRLIASPYNDPLHLLDLDRLDTPNRLLAQALTIFTPSRADYATAGYEESFNWDDVFGLLGELALSETYQWRQQAFYVVTFRSTLKGDADLLRLHELDAHSHQEATASGGLLKYWFGSKDAENRNLATCIWRDRNDARLGGTGPWHKQARAAAGAMYEKIVFTTLKLVIEDDVAGWRFEKWE